MPTQRPFRSRHADWRNTSSPNTMCAGGGVPAATGASEKTAQSKAPARVSERLNKIGLRGMRNDVRVMRAGEEFVDGRQTYFTDVFAELVHVQSDVFAHHVFLHLRRMFAHVFHDFRFMLARVAQAADDGVVDSARLRFLDVAPHEDGPKRNGLAGLRF